MKMLKVKLRQDIRRAIEKYSDVCIFFIKFFLYLKLNIRNLDRHFILADLTHTLFLV